MVQPLTDAIKRTSRWACAPRKLCSRPDTDIHDPAGVLAHEIRRQDTHETGQYDQRDAGCLQLTTGACSKDSRPSNCRRLTQTALDAGCRPFQGKGIRRSVRTTAISAATATVNGIHDGLEVRPPAGAE